MQIVGYDTGDAGLLVSDSDAAGEDERDSGGNGDGGVEYVDLTPGTDLAYTLGERHCAGTIHEGGHVACDAPAAPYCDAHDSVWVCARCTGDCLKDEMDCYDDHAIYLAAFAPNRFKVGVTRKWRLETRLREQGADRGAHIRTVENGRVARQIEAELATADDLVDRVRVGTKRESLVAAVDEAGWESLLDRFDPIETFDFDHGLDLSSRPVAETMATGTVVGTKGRLLVLERGGSTYAVDVRDLVGYELEDGTAERDLQSSLGAFGD